MSVDGVYSPSDLPAPDFNEKPAQEVIAIGRSSSLSEFCDNFGSSLPQEFRVDKGLKAPNEYIEDMKEGDIFVAHEVTCTETLRAKLAGSGKKVTIPKNSSTSFALLPRVTGDVRSLQVRWEGAYTVHEMLKLPSLPVAAAVLTDCKDNNKRYICQGTILYNLSPYKAFRKRGIKGETSDGVGHKFTEGVDTQFSIRYLDIEGNLAEIDEVCKSSLRARVICEGESDLKRNSVVVFEKTVKRVIMLQKVNNKKDLSSRQFPFPIDSGDLKVTPVKGSKQRTSNYYAENPIRVNSSSRFEEPGYDHLQLDVIQEQNVPIDSEGYAKTIPSPLKDSKPEQTTPMQTQAVGYVNTDPGFETSYKDIPSPLKDSKPEQTTPMQTQAVGYVNTNPGFETSRKVSSLPRGFKPGSSKSISPLKHDLSSLSTLAEQTTLTGAGYVNTYTVPKTSNWNRSLPRKLSLDSFMLTPPRNQGSGSTLKEKVGQTSAMLIPSQDELMTSQIFREASSHKDITAVNVSEHITQTCFVLGDVHTLHIPHQGGTFPLHPFGPCGGEQQVECCATLEAPPGVVGSGVTVSVHYAIILDGPFEFPEKWERTSVVLYIDCPEKRLLIKSFEVILHHWVVSSETFHMCFLKSDHLLQDNQTKFTFKCHANVIPSQPNTASVYLKDHFCFVCVAAESDVMVTSRYYGILLSDPLEDRVKRFWLCITYAVPSWVQAVAAYYRKREGSEGHSYIPEYEEMQIGYGNKVKVDMENESGLGWTLSVTKKEVLLKDVDTLSRYTSCREKETAVRFGSYPPSVKFTVTYDMVPSPETHKPIPKLARLSSESDEPISLSFIVQEERAVITDVNMSSNRPVQGAWTEPTHYNHSQVDLKLFGESSKPLTLQHLMPYINDLADKVASISGWLGMDGELEVIKRTPGIINPEEQLQELLKKWLEDTERPNTNHTWEYFVGMVREVRKGHVADRIVGDVFTDSRLPSDPVALEKYVVSKMADNWYQFGIHLGLPEDTLKAIDDSKLLIKNSARCLVMFQRWMEEIGPVENKMDKIEQAMEEVMKVTGDEKSGMTSMCGSEQGYDSHTSSKEFLFVHNFHNTLV